MRHLFIFIASIWATVGLAQEVPPDVVAEMRAADVVILGEVHDNAAHHEVQAQFIRELGPQAVVFEMLSPKMALQVNGYTGDDLGQLGAEIGWEEAGWPDFAIYQPIFEALGSAQAVGAAAPHQMVRDAFARGAAAVFEGDAARFALMDELPEKEQAAREEMQFAAHCSAMPIDLMSGMVEAQRLRDAHFAARTLLALVAHGAPVVVITGNGHARLDWGMPQVMARAAPEVRVFSLGVLEKPARVEDPRYDAVIVTEEALRDDPCETFEK